jgi:hypothetical protein
VESFMLEGLWVDWSFGEVHEVVLHENIEAGPGADYAAVVFGLNENTLMKNIVYGTLAFTMAVGLMIALFYVYPYVPITTKGVVIKSGRLSHVEIDENRKDADNIYLRLAGSSVSYRLDGNFAPRKVAQLQPGAYASIFIPRVEFEKPRVNKVTNESWLPIAGLMVNNQSIFTLDEYNDREMKIGRVFKWFGPAMALLGLWMMLDGVKSLKK